MTADHEADPGLFGHAFRKWPENLRAEEALLGAVMVNAQRVIPRIEEIIEPDHFYDPLHGAIYGAALRLYHEGKTPDVVVMCRQFEGDILLGKRKASDYFAQLAGAMVGLLGVADYAREIRDAWMRRQLLQACIDVGDLCARPGSRTGDAILEQLEESLLALGRDFQDQAASVSIGDAVSKAIVSAKDALMRGTDLAGFSWGYRSLDRLTGGMLPEALYVLGARPAMGKTGVGLGIAMRVAAAGAPVLFWSGEMADRQLGARAGAAWAGLSTQSVFAGRRYDIPEEIETGLRAPLTDWQWRDLAAGELAARTLPMQIDTRGGITVAQLRARARRMKRSKQGLGAIVLDYFQLMRGSARVRGSSRYEEMTEVSNELKALAKELQVPVLVLAQLNREVEKREDKRPQMSDLRDTGALEQDADVLMLLHREHYYLRKQAAGDGIKRREREGEEEYQNRLSDFAFRLKESEGKANLYVPKNRHGPEGACPLRFDDLTTWFRDQSEDVRSPAWEWTGEC